MSKELWFCWQKAVVLREKAPVPLLVCMIILYSYLCTADRPAAADAREVPHLPRDCRQTRKAVWHSRRPGCGGMSVRQQGHLHNHPARAQIWRPAVWKAGAQRHRPDPAWPFDVAAWVSLRFLLLLSRGSARQRPAHCTGRCMSAMQKTTFPNVYR